jgi:histidinol-phosphatase
MSLLREIAGRAESIALGRFRARDLRVDAKPDRSLVTEADLLIEEAARELVRARHPGLGVLGEEQGEQGARDEARLIIDPIDSTANFARGIPIFGTLLAIEERGEIVASLVSAPALGTRWEAVRGEGAHRAGRQLAVSRIGDLAQAQCFHGSLGGYEGGRTPPGLVPLALRTHRQRGFGDFYQHVLVCEGAGEIAIDPIVFPWDVAALLLLAEEAGGRATTLRGERTIYGGSLVTTNGLLHDEVLAALAARP